MNAPPFDVAKARRWFAVECNNHAWELLDKPQRTEAESERLVHAAHAAAFHWLDAGQPPNHVRALQLLGVTYAELARASEALRYSAQALDLARAHAAELAEWDWPFVYEACARAHAAAGDKSKAREFKRLAEDSASSLSDPEDQKIVRHSLASRNWYDIEDIVTLYDQASGATAKVHVGFGFNCYELQLAAGDALQSILWSVPGFESGAERPSRSGIPLLFPFPGRIAGGEFTWEGQSYSIPPTDDRGNAIHGFVLNRPWRVIERSAKRVVGEFQGSVDAPELADRWPADYAIRATYELEASRLVMRYEFWNPDRRSLPCGFGSHPYFRLPIGGANAAECTIALPVAAEWELVELLPTGARRPVPDLPATQAGRPFQQLHLDNVFTQLVFDAADQATAVIRDPQSGRELRVAWDRAFRECVVYTPPHREAICIEPYTCVPGAVQLAGRIDDTGLRVLAPGERFAGVVEFELR